MDGHPGPGYEKLTDLVVFSPDSRRVAYVAGSNGDMAAIIDGKANGHYDDVYGIAFSPDSRHVAYDASSIAGKPLGEYGEKNFIVVDGQTGPLFNFIPGGSLVYGPDGRHLAYLAQLGHKWAIVVDGQQSAWYDSIPSGARPVFDGPNALHTIAARANKIYRVDIALTGK